MKRDIQDALSSVAEVAIFAWSLLELLLTRVLPLAAFFACHLLLQLGSLLTSLVTPGPRRRRRKPRRAEYDSWDAAQAEELENMQAVNEGDDDQNTSESLKLSTDEELEESQQIISGSILPSLTEVDEEEDADADTANEEPPATSAPPEEQVTGLQDTANEEHVTADLQDTANNGQAPGTNDGAVAESSPSDAQKVDLIPPSDVSDENNHRHVAEAEPSSQAAVGVEEQHVSPKEESSASKMDLKPSDVQSSEEATSPREMLRKSSGRRMRGLPPSLSQVKRTLMQRSRRASPSPHTTSPATTAPSPSPTSQKQQRSSRRSASPAIRRASSSFLQKFRNHFLLDAAT